MARYFNANKSLVLDQSTPPENGAMIMITYLPPPQNHPFSQNCYTGWFGVVEDADERSHFNLNGLSNGILLVHGRYDYIRIESIVQHFESVK